MDAEPIFTNAPKQNPALKKKKVREKTIEQKFCKMVESFGGTAYKFKAIGRRDAPDRLCTLPYGVIFFCECKRPGEEPTGAQWREIRKLEALGHNVFVCDSEKQIAAIKTWIEAQLRERYI